MIIVFTAVSRRRRPILIVALLFAVVLGVLGESSDRGTWLPVFAAWAGLTVVLLTLSVVAVSRFRPAALIMRGRAFAAWPNPARVLIASLFLIQGGFLVADGVHDIAAGEELWGFSAAMVAVCACALMVHWRLVWGWYGVQLRADGVHDRQALGSLFIPWDAFVPGYPAVASGSQKVAFHYQHPELVRRRGLRTGDQPATAGSVDATFLARAITEYVSRPEYRSAIGTEAELRRLTAVAG
ncbi:hypothetical protein [Actinoplanes sp. NPDC026623]|uniref:hypothetical protein n=1 Tax=Actinoplanes sp. NPDC026623 TaxID=3155610 RepID=UPI00340F19D7